MTGLTQRETKLAELLREIGVANMDGRQPSKADLCRGKPTKTRADDYRRIDTLLIRGLVRNVSKSGVAYALAITDAGMVELRTWEVGDE